MISVLLLLFNVNYGDSFNDYPSTVTANTTMAVVIDKSFFGNKEEHKNAMGAVQDFIVNTVKKEMHVGGIVVRVFRDVNINLRQDPDCPRFPDSDGISVPLIVPGEELSQIFLDLRMTNVLSWNVINILHDDTFDRDTISRVIKAISDNLPNRKLNLVSRSIFTLKHDDTERSRKNSVRKILHDFHVDQLGHCFLVIATADMVADVMDVMVHPSSQWLYVITDSAMQNVTNMTTFVDLLGEGGNVAFMYNATDFENFCETKLICYIKEFIQALLKALQYSMINEIDLLRKVGYEDFDLIKLTKRERRREILNNITIHLSQNTFASEVVCGRCLLWRFSSSITWGNFFSHGKNEAHLLDIGVWTPNLGVNLTDVIFPHIAHGFRGINLPIATYHNPPWQISTVSEIGEKSYEGLVFDVVRYLSKKLNFTYTVIAPEVSRTARSWNTSRFAKLGETYSFLTSRPRQLSRALLFASPFTKETWACLAVAIIIMGPILYLVHKYSPYSTKTSGLNSSWQCVWYVYGALLQQGGMYLPHSDSARILIGVWWLVVMVLVATYSGSLVAFLTFPRMDASILTVEDLIARKDKITWGFPNGSFLEVYLRNADEPKYHLLLSHAERHNDTEAEQLMERIKEGKHALIDWRSTLRFLMRKDLLLTGGCHFSLSSDEFLDEPIAMIMSQESPYSPVINAELHRMHESGLMNKWISGRMPMKDKCWEIPGNTQAVNKRKVNVADMQGIFFVLFMGITLACFFLFCEFYWHRRKVSKERKLIRPFVS
ncbi:PREDICTED: glutamate receptor ionotropic, delta-2 [Habropoda laboriosa]|uniref:glutamate receptor ionotropic, delta-2 n=1 Tax=Habropoda laboriosa TaxID=597456 RepID=UPI00083DE32F|nr:PREDICTED: glutamate receptor ionotropic, delta-2 [Habropoda laboriosa]